MIEILNLGIACGVSISQNFTLHVEILSVLNAYGVTGYSYEHTSSLQQDFEVQLQAVHHLPHPQSMNSRALTEATHPSRPVTEGVLK